MNATRISSPSGLSAEINANGSIRRIDYQDIMLNLFLGNETEGGPANIHLRRHGNPGDSIPLFGPQSPATCQAGAQDISASGVWGDLTFRVRLVLADSEPAWFWHVEIENTGSSTVTCDLIHTQDLALAHYGAVRLNEYYVSQYIDHTPIAHPRHGTAIASRQNQSMGGSFPWAVIGSLSRGTSYATDALQFHGLTTRAGTTPAALANGLPGKRLQHEHSMAAIQDEPFVLEPGEKSQRGFFGLFLADKPTATSPADISHINRALALPEATPIPFPELSGDPPPVSLFTSAPLLKSQDLDEAETRTIFGSECIHAERENGQLLSFFTAGHSHVVLKSKELRTLRPHGHILRTGSSLTPDESALTTTTWMAGVFHSMVTQGHVSINRFLSTCHSYLGLFRSHGQRVFVEIDGHWHLLDQPSAFEMKTDSCRWIYKHSGGVIEVLSEAPSAKHELRLSITVLSGTAARFLISHHIAINGDDGSASIPVLTEARENGIFVRPISDCDVGRRFPDGGFIIRPAAGTGFEITGNDELLFEDGESRNQPFLCMITEPALTAGVVIDGRLVEPRPNQNPDFWETITSGLHITAPQASPLASAAGHMAGIFPWFIHNALVHYLSPRGLEQYSGGGWGTRDVCQGPVELLQALGHHTPIRDLLLRVFSQQNPDGDWPQWFMFFDRERNIRPGDSHGDIVYWPVLALAQYITSTGDASLLDEPIPYFHPDGPASAENATILQHVERALGLIRARVIPGTKLAAYGHGDWNDSLQPAKPAMRERLCSSWTVTLNYQTFIALAAAFRRLENPDRAKGFESLAAEILSEFQSSLIIDDVIAGLVYFHENGTIDPLLHPRDQTTGLSYRLLPMIHAIINDMLTPDQAASHLDLIREHLLGPDGAHLFNHPMAYHGGMMENFQRAETATYFGREIGIMYMHAHLRYCEALARFGDADAFFTALRQTNPIALRELVPSSTLRQANCYYSSSDPAFADRYQAFDEYEKVKSGEIPIEGGWRVYSSGAGISVRLIMQCFLGLRQETAAFFIDPVIPAALDGLTATLQLSGHSVEVTYHIKSKGCGPTAIQLNGKDLEFTREPNPYRPGAARISMEHITRELTVGSNRLSVWLE